MLRTFGRKLDLLTEQHLTSPVLHSLHSVDVATAFAPRVAALHQAMELAAVADVFENDRLRFEMVRESIDDLTNSFPVGDADDDRGNSRLRELVRRDGWDWSAVDAPRTGGG